MHPTRFLAACGLIAATASPLPLLAQNVPPTTPSGQVAPAGTPVAPPRSATDDGGQRPPTTPSGQTAPAGSKVAPSSLSDPSTATPSPPATTRP